MEAVTNHCRNGIYILVNNTNSIDTFRLEVKISYEYVPTTSFKAWADTQGPRAILNDQ